MGDATGVPTVVIGTAGHIDHGKTSLLRALTGIDADRLPEERARGMTIDVGYAHLAFEDGVELDFVDVPGHDRLIGNMLVGAGEIDAAMLVVAADDGPRPQTIEHLQLLDALRISDGLAVITKIDTVDAARVALVTEQVLALLATTSLAAVRVLPVSSVTGEGIEAIRLALPGVSDRVVGGWQHDSPMRLAIDRAFSAKGRGVVVTGTLRGSLERGASLRREPGGDVVRVREIQVHNHARDRHGGGRTALNLTGLPLENLRRGDVLTTSSGSMGVVGAHRLLVDLGSPASPTRARLRLHLGTDQVDATLRLVTARPRTATLTLDRPVAAFVRGRAVLREPASGAVIAGVQVLDVDPPRGVSRRRMTTDRLEALAQTVVRGDEAEIMLALAALHGATTAGTAMELAPDVRAALEAAAREAVAAHHHDAPLSAGLPLSRARAVMLRRLRALATVQRRDAEAAKAAVGAVLDAMVETGALARNGDALRDPARVGERPPGLEEAMDRLEGALSVSAPPPLDEAAARAGCPPEGIRALTAEGRIVRLAPDLAWATPTYHRLAAVALEHARAAPLTPAAYRDATGTSRKFVMAILEDLDRRGILQRTPEGHVPGPRAPREAAS